MLNLAQLPIAPRLPEIATKVQGNPNTLVIAPTGSGKSVGIPDEMARAGLVTFCTCPTRAAAYNLTYIQSKLQAKYDHYSSFVGSAANRVINYVARTAAIGPDANPEGLSYIVYVTEGHLLELILGQCFPPNQPRRGLEICDVLMIDEIHTGSRNSSLIIILLELLRLDQLRVPHVIYATATPVELNVSPTPAVISIEVPSLPIRYIFNTARVTMNAVQRAVDIHLNRPVSDGHILIFVDGKAEINRIMAEIGTSLGTMTNYVLLAAHSMLEREVLTLIFNDYPGVRKIIVATSIAETSVTIDDVGFVIDTGFIKVSGTSPSGGLSLTTEWESKDSARQRAGRTGRTRAGEVYPIMTEEEYAKLRPHEIEELKRIPAADVLITFAAHQIPFEPLYSLIGYDRVQTFERELVRLRALKKIPGSRETESTEMGRFINMFPISIYNAAFLWSWLYGASYPSIYEIPFELGYIYDQFAATQNTTILGHGQWSTTGGDTIDTFDRDLSTLVPPIGPNGPIRASLALFAKDGLVVTRMARLYPTVAETNEQESTGIFVVEPRMHHRQNLAANLMKMDIIAQVQNPRLAAYSCDERKVVADAGSFDLVVIDWTIPFNFALAPLVDALLHEGVTTTVVTISSVAGAVTVWDRASALGLLAVMVNPTGDIVEFSPAGLSDSQLIVVGWRTQTSMTLRPPFMWRDLGEQLLSPNLNSYSGIVVTALMDAAPGYYQISGRRPKEGSFDYSQRVTAEAAQQYRGMVGRDDLATALNMWSRWEAAFGQDLPDNEDLIRDWAKANRLVGSKIVELIASVRRCLTGVEQYRNLSVVRHPIDNLRSVDLTVADLMSKIQPTRVAYRSTKQPGYFVRKIGTQEFDYTIDRSSSISKIDTDHTEAILGLISVTIRSQRGDISLVNFALDLTNQPYDVPELDDQYGDVVPRKPANRYIKAGGARLVREEYFPRVPSGPQGTLRDPNATPIPSPSVASGSYRGSSAPRGSYTPRGGASPRGNSEASYRGGSSGYQGSNPRGGGSGYQGSNPRGNSEAAYRGGSSTRGNSEAAYRGGGSGYQGSNPRGNSEAAYRGGSSARGGRTDDSSAGMARPRGRGGRPY